MKTKSLAMALGCLLGLVGEAEADAEDASADAGPAQAREGSFAAVPGPFLSKETGWGLGVKVGYSFYTSDRQDLGLASYLDADAAYTVRKQATASLTPRVYLDGKNWIVGGRYQLLRWPEYFWGVGNDLPDVRQRWEQRAVRFRSEIQRYVGARFWSGVVHTGSFTRVRDIGRVVDADGETLPGIQLLDDSVEGFGGGLSNGFGLSLLYDTRDHVLLPTRGGYRHAQFVAFDPAWGSDSFYTLWQLDLRQFFALTRDSAHVLALQLLGEMRGGRPPFYEMGRLGGPYQMRGYYEGRYRDRHYVTGQAEYRFPIYWRLSAVTFAALGEVFGEDRWRPDRLRWTAGAGLRFRFGKDILIRLDAGFGPGTDAIIIDGGHAF